MRPPQDDQERLDQLLAEYFQRVDAGEVVDRNAFVREHPDVAAPLGDLLAMGELLERAIKGDAGRDGRASPPADHVAAATVDSDQGAAETGVSATCDDSPARSSRRFGDFQLISPVARGGMGIVFKARQIKLNRVVALKFIATGALANRDDLRRFRAEAEAAGKLDHPAIVPVFDFGVHQGQHYLVMAYVEGMSLAKRIVDGPLPPDEAAGLLHKVAAAVAYAHARGVVHRDLKPGNILISGDGEPRVTDFGLAKRVDQQSSLTATGQVLGTPSYMPPEQAEGRLDDVGPLSDVYSLGATLYATLTGRPPFQAATPVETLRQVLDQQPVPPRRLNPNVPPELETICLKCLEKGPAARYVSAEATAGDLRRYLAGEPITAVPIGPFQRAWRWAQRHRAAALQIGVAVVLLFGAIAGLSLYNSQLSSMNAVTGKALQAEQAARRRAGLEMAKAEAQASIARAAQEKAERAATDLDRALAEKTAALDKLTAAVKRAERERQRADRQGVLASTAQQAATKAGRARDQAARQQAQVEYVQAIAQAAAELEAGNRSRGLAILTATSEACRSWEWSYLRRQCTTDSRSRLDVAASELETIRHPAAVERVAIAPNGRWLALAGADGTVRVINMATHTESLSAKVGDGPLSTVAFDPSSRVLAAAGAGPVIDLWNLRDGGTPVHLQSTAAGTNCLAFDTQGLAAGGADGVIRYWNLAGKRAPLQLRKYRAPIKCLEFIYLPGTEKMPEGTSLLMSVDARGTLLAWYSRGVSRAEPLDVLPRIAWVAAGHGQGGGLFLSQGNQRALSRCMVQLTDLFKPTVVVKEKEGADGQPVQVQEVVPKYTETVPRFAVAPRPILPGLGPVFSVSRDGNWIATGKESMVEVWSIATGQRIKRLAGHKDLVTATAWTPDASLLVSSSRDGTVRIWRMRPGVRRHADAIRAVAFAATGNRFASVDRSGLICVWTHPKGRLEASLRGARDVGGLAFGPQGRRLASVDGGKRVSLWDVAEGKLAESWPTDAGQVTCLAFDPTGRALAWATTQGRIAIQPLDSKGRSTLLEGHRGAVRALAFHSDGGQLVSVGDDRLVRLWNGPDWSPAALQLKGHDAEIVTAAYSRQGDRLATGDRNGAVVLWDPIDGTRHGQLAAEGRPIGSLVFSRDGSRLFTADSSQRVTVWDTQSQLVVLRLTGQAEIHSAAISADGRTVAAGNQNGSIEVWETETAGDLVRRQFARAAGLLAERFAICQTMPLADFQSVAATLSDRGYRPTRLRPYSTADGLVVAAVWTRDQRPWRMVIDNGRAAVAAEHQKLAKRGFVACDLASYMHADRKGSTAVRYSAVWVKADGPTPRSRIDMGVAGSLTALEKKRSASGLLPMACHEMIDAKGKRLANLVWRSTTSASGRTYIDRGKSTAIRRSGLTQTDVALICRDGQTASVRLWREGAAHTSRELDGGNPEQLAEQFQELVADGYLPVAVAVTPDPAGDSLGAASVWHKAK